MLESSPGILALALFAVACGPSDMDKDEVSRVLFGSNTGVLAGYAFGDSWDDIKSNHDEVFEVRDNEFKQLRRKVSDNAGANGYFIGFGLDDGGKVSSFHASINGSQQNAVTVRVLLDDIIARYDKSIGKGSCTKTPGGEGNSSHCSWTAAPEKIQVELMYLEMSDPIRGSISLDIEPPKG